MVQGVMASLMVKVVANQWMSELEKLSLGT